MPERASAATRCFRSEYIDRAAAAPSMIAGGALTEDVVISGLRRVRAARRGRRLEHLEENLVLLDHAELAARAFLDRFLPDLEVADLGFQCTVARLQLAIGVALGED